jgi:hypothetical protein
MPEYFNIGMLKLGDLTGETKLSGALLKPSSAALGKIPDEDQ